MLTMLNSSCDLNESLSTVEAEDENWDLESPVVEAFNCCTSEKESFDFQLQYSPLTLDFNNGNKISDAVIMNCVNSNVNKNTKKKRNWATKSFNGWLATEIENTDKTLQSFTTADLNHYLPRFIIQARDTHGEMFKPKTLFELLLCLQQDINENRLIRGEDALKFLSDPQFYIIKQVLDSEMRRRTREGISHPSHSQTTDYITESMENEMWDANILGSDDPSILTSTLFYLIGVHFALRGGEEHVQLTLDNFSTHIIDGKKVLKYNELVSKTYAGGIKDVKRKPKEVIAFANEANPRKCIVNLFGKYLEHRPRNVKRLYLRSLDKPKDKVWYSGVPIGKNNLSQFVYKMCLKAGFHGKFSNHSLRATCATRLFQKGVEEQLISNVTGHRSNAVQQYKRISNDQLANLSNILHCNTNNQASCSGFAAFATVTSSITEDCNSLIVQQPRHKKMEVLIDGESNNVKIIFQ